MQYLYLTINSQNYQQGINTIQNAQLQYILKVFK